jgi:putative tryptophan/tyrosine transport system substrate-binding protein
MFNPTTAPFAENVLKSLNDAATHFGVEARIALVRDVSELETAIATQAPEPNSELGGLISYGVDLNDNFRRAVPYADRILTGAKPSELPVQAPVKFELVINLKTANALGLAVPPSVRNRADEVIE